MRWCTSTSTRRVAPLEWSVRDLAYSFQKREEEPMKPNPWPGLLALLMICCTVLAIVWMLTS